MMLTMASVISDATNAVLRAGKPERGILCAEDAEQGHEHDVTEHVAVQRHPQPQDEPPAGHRQDEADRAAQDAALPDVIAARARHDGDQPA
jgi:hypothetical protein